jgi:hypothetical protein
MPYQMPKVEDNHYHNSLCHTQTILSHMLKGSHNQFVPTVVNP